MKHLVTIILLLSVSTMSFAQGRPIETKANITNITIYTSAAEVNHEKEVVLEKGKNTVIFKGLTPFIVPNTINIKAVDPDVNIITVTDKMDYITRQQVKTSAVHALNDSIALLTDQSGLIQVRIDALEMEKELLFKGESIGGVAAGVPTDEIEKASNFFQTRYLKLSTDLYNLNKQNRNITSSITALKRQIKQMTTTSTQNTSEIKLVVNAPSRRKVKFEFKFLTSKAGWAPIYDFKYEGPNNPLGFIFRANVFNASEIPWNDVNIKLSTADPIRGFSLPSLEASSNPQAQPIQHKNGQEVKFQNIQVSNVIAEYEIKHKYTIPSDAKPYLVEVDGYDIPTDFSYLVIPKLDPFAFLMAKVPDWNKHNLIPGTANIYSMGTYMGKTFLNTYAQNDTLSLYLGKEQGIQVTRKEKNVEQPRNLIGNYAIDKTWVDITIKNSTGNTLAIEVLDQVPLVRDGDKVKLNTFDIPEEVHNTEDGMLTWKLNVSSGQTVDLDFRYELKAPKEHRDALRQKRTYFRTISCPSF